MMDQTEIDAFKMLSMDTITAIDSVTSKLDDINGTIEKLESDIDVVGSDIEESTSGIYYHLFIRNKLDVLRECLNRDIITQEEYNAALKGIYDDLIAEEKHMDGEDPTK